MSALPRTREIRYQTASIYSSVLKCELEGKLATSLARANGRSQSADAERELIRELLPDFERMDFDSAIEADIAETAGKTEPPDERDSVQTPEEAKNWFRACFAGKSREQYMDEMHYANDTLFTKLLEQAQAPIVEGKRVSKGRKEQAKLFWENVRRQLDISDEEMLRDWPYMAEENSSTDSLDSPDGHEHFLRQNEVRRELQKKRLTMPSGKLRYVYT